MDNQNHYLTKDQVKTVSSILNWQVRQSLQSNIRPIILQPKVNFTTGSRKFFCCRTFLLHPDWRINVAFTIRPEYYNLIRLRYSGRLVLEGLEMESDPGSSESYSYDFIVHDSVLFFFWISEFKGASERYHKWVVDEFGGGSGAS